MTLPRRAWLAAPLLLLPGCASGGLPVPSKSQVAKAKRFSAQVNAAVQKYVAWVAPSIAAEFDAQNTRIQAIPDSDGGALLREELRILIAIGQRAVMFIPAPFGAAVSVILGFLASLIGAPLVGVTGERSLAPGMPALPAATLADAEHAAKVLREAK